MKKLFIKLLLINILFSCNIQSNEEGYKLIEISYEQLNEIKCDHKLIIIPSVACFECHTTAYSLIERYGQHLNYQIIISGSYNKNSRIMFDEKVRDFKNVKFDSLGFWTEYTTLNPSKIIVVFVNDEFRTQKLLKLDSNNIEILNALDSLCQD